MLCRYRVPEDSVVASYTASIIGNRCTLVKSATPNRACRQCAEKAEQEARCDGAFISTSAAAGLSLSGACAADAATGDIPKRVFGKTGERLTIIGQAGRFPLCSYEDAKAVTMRAYELGINYFDCARIYWKGNQRRCTAMSCHRFASTYF